LVRDATEQQCVDLVELLQGELVELLVDDRPAELLVGALVVAVNTRHVKREDLPHWYLLIDQLPFIYITALMVSTNRSAAGRDPILVCDVLPCDHAHDSRHETAFGRYPTASAR
jgi:hypothetical protein